MLCYRRRTGERLWQTEVHRGGFEKKGNSKGSLASSTAACDGRRVFINFLHKGAIYTTALSREGKLLWQTKIADYVLHQGFGSSPAVYQSLVIVSADNKGGGTIAALQRATGEVVWKRERPKTPNYTSPIILQRGRPRATADDGLRSGHQPRSAHRQATLGGQGRDHRMRDVNRHRRPTGLHQRRLSEESPVRGAGRWLGRDCWEKNTRVYVPSLLAHRGHLFGVLDAGIAMCWKCDSGEEVWKGRLGGTFSASPVLVGDHLFATNEAGRTFIFKATPETFSWSPKTGWATRSSPRRPSAAAASTCASPLWTKARHGRGCTASASANRSSTFSFLPRYYCPLNGKMGEEMPHLLGSRLDAMPESSRCQSASRSKCFACQAFIRLAVLGGGTFGHIRRQFRRRTVLVPAGRLQPVAHELLVE